MAEQPFALLVTWTCYGTWLPGDSRGYVSNTLRPDGTTDSKHNTPGTSYTANDDYTRLNAVQLQKSAPVHLSGELAAVVAVTLVNAASQRNWRVLRAAVMWNHVHVVIMDCPDDGPAVRRVLKGTTQAELSRQVDGPRRWWTTGGSDRYLHGESAIQSASDYVAGQHGILAEVVDMKVTKP